MICHVSEIVLLNDFLWVDRKSKVEGKKVKKKRGITVISKDINNLKEVNWLQPEIKSRFYIQPAMSLPSVQQHSRSSKYVNIDVY